MKRLVQRFSGGVPWVRLCYLLAAVLWLAWGLYRLGADALARAGGRLAEREVPLDAFTLVGLEDAGGGALASTGYDPQMHLDVTGSAVRSLLLRARYSGEPREICLYYTTRPGEDFSQDRRVFPTRTGDGVYRFDLPFGSIAALRLDPCSNTVALYDLSVTLNPPGGGAGYLIPSWYQLFCLALYPALAAAIASTAQAAVRALRQKRQGR